ncbi:hypothetical protein [Capnocytophaga leadbetteri]|uniref:hypothetical protein n=1 Tax=Capnocytophaga leadbetteri TaxID=327575 RepID=UPI0026EF6729|nr:hypothetical protein [Capnocytophaga leadbetteri]
MKIILIQGAENTGKTTLCNQIDEWLQKEFIDEYSSKRSKKIEKMVVTKDISLDTDFFALYDIKQKESIKHKRIIINSLSDEVEQFYKFKDFFEEHKEEKTNIVKDAINSYFDILLKNEKENKKDKKEIYKNIKEIYKNIKEIYETKERCLEKISEIHNSDSDIDTLKQKKKDLIYNEIEECLKGISDISTSNVDTLKQKIKDFCDERISQPYTQSKEPDLLITAIRPSGTDLYNQMKDILELDDLEKLELSPKTIYSYQEDTSKDILLIQLEKTPLELIKEEIRKIFK